MTRRMGFAVSIAFGLDVVASRALVASLAPTLDGSRTGGAVRADGSGALTVTARIAATGGTVRGVALAGGAAAPEAERTL
jgi:hypothetical protein